MMPVERPGFFDSEILTVKVCGITNADDAARAVEAGADAIGINLFELSKRFVRLPDAVDWIAEIPVTRIAVVVNADQGLIESVLASGLFDAMQFHGDESPADCAKCGVPWIRAVRVQSPECLESALAYDTPWLLLDAFSAGAYGGTGSRVDWAVASTFINNQPSRRVTLAGGLTVENVTAAVKSVRPFAVDVASGVESSGNPRKKDPRRMQDFIQSAKRAASK